jgi:diacylglycerol kinase (ATP)
MPAPRPRKFLIVHNPAAGQRQARRMKAYLEAIRAGGGQFDLAATEAPGDATKIAAQASGAGYDALVAAGGDGTVNEMANGLSEGAPPLGFIPLGTANVLAWEKGIGVSARNVAKTLLEGEAKPVHLGRVNGRRFVLMAGAGFDAQVVEDVDLALKRAAGKFAYVAQTLKGALNYGFPEISVTLDGEAAKAYGVVVCNARFYGGPFIAAPNASLLKPGFEVCLLGGRGLFSVLRYGAALALGLLPKLSGVRIVTARHVVIEGPEGLPLQADGDIVARLPALIDIDPQPLTFLMPR